MPKPKAYLFDVFGTIVDWRSGVATVAREFFDLKDLDENPHSFADAWRAKYQPAMENVRSGNRGFVKLDTLHRENLDELLADLHLEQSFSEDDRTEFNKAWE
ncbi:MAG: haloacid dehalogenase type II, partial [Pseudomonadota bacterium]